MHCLLRGKLRTYSVGVGGVRNVKLAQYLANPQRSVNMLRYYMLLFLVGIVVCQYQGANYGTSRTRQQSRSSTRAWSGSTRYAPSRTANSRTTTSSFSRYDAYKPLDTYRRQYGSSIQTYNKNISTSSSSSALPAGVSSTWRYTGYGQHGQIRGQNNQNHSTSQQHRSRIVNHVDRSRHYGRTHTSQTAVVPPLTESSTGFTHYATLSKQSGRGRSRNQRPYPAPLGRDRPGRKKERIAGEGYGEAYLEWSEYGVGKDFNAT